MQDEVVASPDDQPNRNPGQWTTGPIEAQELDDGDELQQGSTDPAGKNVPEIDTLTAAANSEFPNLTGVVVPVPPMPYAVLAQQVRDTDKYYMEGPGTYAQRVNRRNAAVRDLFTSAFAKRAAAYAAYRYEHQEGFTCTSSAGNTRNCRHGVTLPDNHQVLSFEASGNYRSAGQADERSVGIHMRKSGRGTNHAALRVVGGFTPVSQQRSVAGERDAFRALLAQHGLPDDRVPDVAPGTSDPREGGGAN